MAKHVTFDCIQMKRDAAARIYQQIKGMTPQQELAFWRRRSVRLQRRIERAKVSIKRASRDK